MKEDKFGENREDNYYYISVRNKTNEMAINSKAKCVFKDKFAYNLIWKDPLCPKNIDISVEEYLFLFYYDGNKFILPDGSVEPSFVNKKLPKDKDSPIFWTYKKDLMIIRMII